MSLKAKLTKAMGQKLSAQELLKYLCPFDIEVKFKILANQKFKGIHHDYAVLMQIKAGEDLFQDPKDVECFVTQMLAERQSNLLVLIETVKQGNEIFTCIFMDFPKAT